MRVSENKTRALISIMIFALLVGGLTFVSAYFSLQKQAIVGQAPAAALPDSQQLSAQKTDVSGELRPSAPSLSPSQSAAARVEDGEQDLAPPNPPAPSYTTLFVTPRSGGLCIVSSASGIQEFRPKLECVAGEGFSQYRVYCPIEIAVGGAYTLSGSCS